MPSSNKAFLLFICCAIVGILGLNYWPKFAPYYEQLRTTGQITFPLKSTEETASTSSSVERSTEIQDEDPGGNEAVLIENPADTLEWLNTQDPSQERLESILEVVALWAANDSENALVWLESNAEGTTRLKSLDRAISIWAESEPAQAASWIEGMANDDSKTAAAIALTNVWAATEPQMAVAWLSSLPMSPTRDQASVSLVQTWAESNPQAAAEWALSEAEVTGNRDLLDQSITALTLRDPEQAETWVRFIAENFESPEGLETFLRTRAQTDPSRTMDAMLALAPEDPINAPDNPTIIMEEWGRIDSVGASGWLMQQPASPSRDAAIDGFINSILNYEPMAAAEWGTAMTDPELRMNRLDQVLKSWIQNDATEATTWLDQAAIENSEKRLLLQSISLPD
jgi:hypothetical protein